MLSPGMGDTLDIAPMIEAALSSLDDSLAVTSVSTGSSAGSLRVLPAMTNGLLSSLNGLNGSI